MIEIETLASMKAVSHFLVRPGREERIVPNC